ncbi:GDP/GTP exchange factor for ARF [Ophidiomyces ophidiicola]|uniref:GDP/GTP exchange factor for ARF n=1 Tax=Ophidiomyces ophidiicola TaxID=1387563 RepID=A0ACB8UU19_9EURO|nr:GDP/GTP exchange factor for ARF [Ophidiomyces ophidiicola]KAI1971566.1 GDP/GTP exchange factor for ARF [Ophidiomyces ophidiicola]KAI2019305.1 GDP/GTP exchange factor for ARF [Ophidiomyces ophidiicola]KAI2050383.1 GDP/GTP exchange factor for ARF [Ophidiomyces ophidiicola]KAI2076508.1 GDP/GTP exchange factor for ARF [Ophidiomyces ophidiicola]
MAVEPETSRNGELQPLSSQQPPGSPSIALPNLHTEILAPRLPISIAVDPIALVTSECITVTSAMRKHARWAHSSVAAILGGSGSFRTPDWDPPIPSTPQNPTSGTHTNDKSTPSKSNTIGSDSDFALAGRWGLRGKKGKSLQDNPLMSAFTRLRVDLKECRNIHIFDTPSLLHPFLQVIRSSSTSAPITSLALIAITKFFAYNIINQDSPRLSMALQRLSAAITHCRFEASDSAADEIVLLRILKLMEGMISRPEGELLGDESVCEMMETGLSMCCQVRLSEVLRRSAEIAMVNMCQVIFQRLCLLDAENEIGAHRFQEDPSLKDAGGVKMDPSVDGDTVASQHQSSLDPHTPNPEVERPSSDHSSNTTVNGDGTVRPEEFMYPEAKPYGLPSIRELFRVLIDLLDPHNPQHTDAMRVMSLRIIDVALEVAGPSIARHPSLAQLARDDLCRYLFQLVKSENMAILSASLRAAGTLLSTCRYALKLQQELFLSYLVACLHPRVGIPQEVGIDPALYAGVPQAPKLVKPSPSQAGSGRSTPVPVKDRQKLGMEGGSRKPEARESMVETIGVLARIPNFMTELFVNYDCDVNQADLCEDMVGLLSRNAFPDSATWSTTNVPPLCLDALLGYIQCISDRLDNKPNFDNLPSLAALKQQRQRKKLVIQGATKFNEDPKSGIAFLASNGIIEDIEDPKLIAKFLKGTSRISKKVLGEYISNRKNEKILEAFMELFEFAGVGIVEALRNVLGSFRLPGEAPLIQRIVTIFAEKYLAGGKPKEAVDADSLFILTYATIMLNTDLHNPNVKPQNRMTVEGFTKNLSGVNAGGNFPVEYLEEIYRSIQQNEIILPDEHENKHAFEYAWKELLLKAASVGVLIPCDSNIFDAEMFEATWRPVVATLSYVFMSASDDAVFSRVVIGFDQCAKIATKYGVTDALDRIIFCLSSISTLASETPPNITLNTEVQIGKKVVMVSELAVKLGRDFRAQLATVVLFRVLSGSEAVIRNGWEYVVRILHHLFINSLIPQLDIRESGLDIPPIPLQPPSQVVDRDGRGTEAGLLSAFTSYLSSYAADDPPEPSDEEIENTLCTIDCINACCVSELLENIRSIPISSMTYLVNILLSKLPDTSPAVIVVKPERPRTTRPASSRSNFNSSRYNPGLIYVLELTTLLVLRDAHTTQQIGEILTRSLHDIIRDPKNIHPLMLSRVICYLLVLLRRGYEHSFMRPPVILHTISSFDQDVLESVAVPIVAGLTKITNETPLWNEITRYPDFWSILQRLHQHQDGAILVFELLQKVVESGPPIVSADNYEAAVGLANDFASSGSVVALRELQQDISARRSKPMKKTSKAKDDPLVIRSVKAINLIYHMTARIPILINQSHLERNEAWTAYWSPIFSSLSTQCINPSRDIRHQAISALQRSLLSPELASTDHKEWVAIFGEVLFPLIIRLLKPEVYQSDPAGMSETRVQAATLLCKIFLHYLVLLSEWDGMLDLWLKILDILDRMMNSGQGDSLEEAVPESLKNILLIMADGGYIAPPGKDPTKERIWTETQKRLDRFLPNLFKEIFPSVPEEDSAPATEPPRSQPRPLKSGSDGEKPAVKTERSQEEQNEVD